MREQVAVLKVMRSGNVAQGPEVAKFESEFTELALSGLPCLAVNSGTSALHLGLLALGIGPGDEVIVPSFTFAATANAVVLTGARPVFCDVDADTLNLSSEALESLVGPRTRAVIAVHLFGMPANMEAISAVTAPRGILLVEDAAQAHMAEINGKKVGTFGDLAAFSFYPTKNMTSGEGGMVSSGSESILERISLLRNQGMRVRYHNEIAGFNNRMTDIHAAIGRVQLRSLPSWTRRRIENASFFNSEIEGVVVPKIYPEIKNVFHQYVIRVPEDRDGFKEALLTEFGIESGVYYPVPVHDLVSMHMYPPRFELSNTISAASQALALPVHPGLSRRDRERIVTGVNRLATAGK